MSESSPIAKDMPTMTEIKRYLLPDPNLNQSSVFDVDSQKGLSFFLFDLVVCTASLTSLTFIATNLSFQSLNLPFQFLSIFPLELFTGTALWAMWCIGHDAGHGLINRPKKNNKVNDIVGEVAHSIFCLTPFAPWRRSHKLHHLHHNHVTDDFSHQWFIREDGLPDWIKNAYLLRNLQLPFLYLTYLAIGIPDGSHFFFYPGCGGRMWEKAGEREMRRCAISSATTVATVVATFTLLGPLAWVQVVFVPYLVLSMWLFTVTYLQHHSEDGKLYDDSSFDFARAAFETVDRDYGQIANLASHNMMDGHVAHHLFFSMIPHYQLIEARERIKKGLEKDGFINLYKSVETKDYLIEILKQWDENWFFAHEANVVRKSK